jgi:hypothetical protein
MSNATAQSTSELTKTGQSEKNWDYAASVARAASRKTTGITREAHNLRRQQLVDSCKADYRAHFASVYGKTDRLPTDIFNAIELAVDTFITSQLGRINAANAISFRRGFYWAEKDMSVTERVTAVGENKITLQEQKLGIVIFIAQAKKRLKDLEAKPTPDLDAEKECKSRIMRLEVTKSFIEREIACEIANANANANPKPTEPTEPTEPTKPTEPNP